MVLYRRLRANAATAFVVLGLGLAAATPASADLTTPTTTAPTGWLATATDPDGVAAAISAARPKLAKEFDARLRYVQSDGLLRVMVSTTARTPAIEAFIGRSVTDVKWYGTTPAFLATVTPDQLATLASSSDVRFVEPDYPISYSLATSAPDVRARAATTFTSVLPDGSQDGTVSLEAPSVSWSGDATSQGFTIANILVDAAGVRPVCAPSTCHTFRLHVTDPGDLQLAVEAGTTLVAVEVERPDGATSYETGRENPVIAVANAQPGTYVVRIWLNSLGAAPPFAATATLSAPDATGGQGLWSFDPSGAVRGVLRPAARLLSTGAATGEGVTAAIIDSGIDKTHPDFGGFTCTAAPGAPCESRIKEAVVLDHISGVGVDIGPDLPTTEAASGHGTHVAGTIAGNGYMARDAAATEGSLPGATPGAGIPIGIAPQASLVSVKNGDTLWAGLSSFGLTWVAENAARLGIRAVNNSWGCSGGCAFDGRSAAALQLKALYDAGVLVAFAAGNDGGDASGTTLSGNAQSPYVVGVANYDASSHLLASSSSRGLGGTPLPSPATWTPESEPVDGYRRPDVGAPGQMIAATRSLTGGAATLAPRADTSVVTGGDGTGTGGYARISGTSMATPHVVGAATALFSACPDARVLDVMRALMATADSARIKTTDGSRTAESFEVGYGGLDVLGALGWLRANVPACVPGSAPTAAIAGGTGAQAGTPTAFDGTGSSDPDGPITSYRWAFGDGATATGAVAQHTYAAPGTYTVQLAVTDEDGRAATAAREVVVAPEPDPDPATPTLTSGEPASGTGAAADAWRYAKVRVPAGATGLDVTLDGPECSKRCKPNLDLYVREATTPTTTTFACKAAGATSDEVCTTASPAAGYWYVGVLTESGKAGADYTLTATVRTSGGGDPTPNVAPTADFAPTCVDLACTFADASSDSDGTVASRSWDFGDGATSTATSPAHTYAAPGTYAVRLTVTDDDGASGTVTRSVVVTEAADPDPSTPTLQNGVATSDQNGATGTWRYFKVKVPEGRSTLEVAMAGEQTCADPLSLVCSPDLDVYVQAGAKPTEASYACRQQTATATETCTIADPAAGYWYVGVFTYAGGTTPATEDQITFTVKATHS